MNGWLKRLTAILWLGFLQRRSTRWSIFCLISALIIAHVRLSASVRFKLYKGNLRKLFFGLMPIKAALKDELKILKV